MLTEQRLHDLIRCVYQAATSPAGWDGFLLSLSDAFGGGPAHFMAMHSGNRRWPALLQSVRMSPDVVREVSARIGEEDPWRKGSSTLSSGQIALGSELATRAAVRASAYYHEICKPSGADDVLVLHLESGSEVEAFLVLNRSAEVGLFQQSDREHLALLAPHVQQAYHLHKQFGGLSQRCHQLESVLNAIDCAVLVLTRQGECLHGNERARALMASADGIGLRGQQLHIQAADCRLKFQALLAGVAQSSYAAGGKFSVRRPSGKRPYQLLLSPLSAPEQWLLPNGGSALCLLIHDPEQCSVPPAETLSLLLGVTSTEAILANLLASGLRPAQAAERMHISVLTARSHLKQLLAKTGCHSQVQLVRLVLTLVW